MKIKLAILEADSGYLNRIISVFSTKYSDKFEIYSFTEEAVALSALEAARIDVFIASDAFEIDTKQIPKRCGFAYFVDSMGIETLNQQPTICRFQKADLIYKQILSIYAEHAGNFTELKLNDDKCKVLAFASPSGGAGSSSMAAACAVHYAAKGGKTLYLNLDKFAATEDFFQGEGQFDMSDVIYALKSRRANLHIKLESCIKQDASGVFFYSQTKQALDMLELKTEEILRLISELKLAGTYDYIILDAEFGLDKDSLEILHQAYAVVVVGDGSAISNAKIFRAYTALATKEQSAEAPLVNRMLLAYNKFSSKTGEALKNGDMKLIGGAPRYEQATARQVVMQLSRMTMLDEIEK